MNLPFNATNGKVATNGSKAYLYTNSAINNFWEFDPGSNTWTQKTDYPAGMRQYETMFAIGSKVYLGLGSSSPAFATPDADDTFYQYNVNTNSWSQIASYPDAQYYGFRNLASAFVINNIAYVGCGATNTGMYKFYAYSPVSNSWYGIQDFPAAQSYTTGFSFGSYGFIANGQPLAGTPTHDCYKYDPVADAWTHLNDYIGCNPCGWGIERGYAFVNNGNVYVGGGNSSSSTFYLYQAVGSGL
jgi:N-acetylneuraminic acid mutarotase